MTELTVFFEIVKKRCKHCHQEKMHEHGHKLHIHDKQSVVIMEMWICVRCGLVSHRRVK